MAKSRNNLLGVGGQRTKLPRNGRPDNAPGGPEDRRKAQADQKQDLLRRMRERTLAQDGNAGEAEEPRPDAPDAADAGDGATGTDAS